MSLAAGLKCPFSPTAQRVLMTPHPGHSYADSYRLSSSCALWSPYPSVASSSQDEFLTSAFLAGAEALFRCQAHCVLFQQPQCSLVCVSTLWERRCSQHVCEPGYPTHLSLFAGRASRDWPGHVTSYCAGPLGSGTFSCLPGHHQGSPSK